RHETGRHVEVPARLRSVTACLEASGLTGRCTPGTSQPLSAKEIERVHDRAVVQRAKQVAEHGGGMLDADTVVSPESFQVALAAAGACSSAVDAVLKGPDPRALCLVRPPGHHATSHQSMGFCLFNNIALAAAQARLV